MSEVDGGDLSALRENIEKKGKNSYYYAHGPKVDGPKWDGNAAPQKLESSTAGEEARLAKLAEQKSYSQVVDYAWGDGKKLVTVYVDFEKAMDVADEDMSVEAINEIVEFTFTSEGKHFKLFVDNLNAEVSSASCKKKDGQFKVLLRKAEESPWFNLKKTS